jgi:hypothetical protein
LRFINSTIPAALPLLTYNRTFSFYAWGQPIKTLVLRKLFQKEFKQEILLKPIVNAQLGSEILDVFPKQSNYINI